jgi:hypothetical protein
MGVGAAYANLVWLLSNQESCQPKVDHIFNFVSENSLIAAQRPADDFFSDWYYKASIPFPWSTVVPSLMPTT